MAVLNKNSEFRNVHGRTFLNIAILRRLRNGGVLNDPQESRFGSRWIAALARTLPQSLDEGNRAIYSPQHKIFAAKNLLFRTLLAKFRGRFGKLFTG